MKPKEDYQSELVFLKPSIQESLYKQLKEETCFPKNTNFPRFTQFSDSKTGELYEVQLTCTFRIAQLYPFLYISYIYIEIGN